MAANKPKPKTQVEQKVHPWRPCALGKHWVSAHTRNRISSKGNPYTQSVGGYCRTNPSHQDHLYKDDIYEVSENHFSKLSGPPAANELTFKGIGNKYDHLIRGWTRYWNDVLQPSDLLDPDLIKALIASESSFNPNAYNGLKGDNAARGLMQVLNKSVQLLKNSKELRDHFVNLDEDDMKDPNLTICAGIRWLFRKKQILESRRKQKVSWRDAVADYKGVKPDEKKLMPRFDSYYNALKGIK